MLPKFNIENCVQAPHETFAGRFFYWLDGGKSSVITLFGRLHFWRCEYTGEIIAGTKNGGNPLFGTYLPFIGFKRIVCDCNGDADDQTWPPKFTTVRMGVMWFWHGQFYNPPWATDIRAVREAVVS